MFLQCSLFIGHYFISFLQLQINWSMFISFPIKDSQTMLHIFMIMDPAVQMGIWPCSASLRIHQLVSPVCKLIFNISHLIITALINFGMRCRLAWFEGVLFEMRRCNDEIITLVWRLELITVIPFGL